MTPTTTTTTTSRRRRPTDIVDLLDAAAAGRGTVRFADDRASAITLRRVWSDAARVQRDLTRRSSGRAPRTAMLLRATRPAVTTLLGAWRAGGTVISLPMPTRHVTAEGYGRLLDQLCGAAQADVVAVDPDVAALLLPLSTPLVLTTDLGRGDTAAGSAGEPVPGGRLVQCSSGSTSDPKGIDLALTAVAANVEAILARLDLGPRCATVSWLPLSHDMGLIGMLLATLVNLAPGRSDRGGLTLLHPEEFLADPRIWFRTISQSAATVSAAPAFALARMLRVPDLAGDLSSMEALICGGERIDPIMLGRFDATITALGCPRGAIRPAYGLAEATLAVSISGPDGWRTVGSPTTAGELVTCGAPLDGTEVRVGDDAGSGCLEVRSPSLLSGYVGSDRPCPVGADGWFRTADIGHLDHGEVVVAGRSDDVLVVRGRNVSALDLEATVARTVAAEQSLAIRPGGIAVITGREGELVLALETLGSDDRVALGRHLRRIDTALRTEHGLRPDRVCLMAPGGLPRTTSGKLRRNHLRDQIHAGRHPVTAP